jgi:uncharacterized membrane protein YjfL (UPF0719 family)
MGNCWCCVAGRRPRDLVAVFDWLSPIDEWAEIKKGNTSVAIIMGAVVLALGIAIGFAIMPVPVSR